MKDWIGNQVSTYATLGASNHSDGIRETNDFYATDPTALEKLLDTHNGGLSNNIWECACGMGHLSEVLLRRGYNVTSTDRIDRGYGIGNVDFLQQTTVFDGDILTNPPYKYAQEFIEHALDLVTEGHKVVFFLKLQFLEGKGRRALFNRKNLKTVYVSSGRFLCGKNADFTKMGAGSSAIAYAWYVFEKGYNGDPTIKWFN